MQSSKASAFTLNNNLALSFEQDTVNTYVASGFCTNLGLSESEINDIVREAADRYWNTVSTSRLRIKAAGLTTVSSAYKTDALCTTSVPSCTVNSALQFTGGILVTCNNDTTSNFPTASLLAVTVPVAFAGKSILGSVLMINDTTSTPLKNKTRQEMVSLLAHEIGHAIGLGHSKVQDSLMYYLSIPERSGLGWDDVDGVTYLYPKEQPVSCGTVATKDENSTRMFLQMLVTLTIFLSLWKLIAKKRERL